MAKSDFNPGKWWSNISRMEKAEEQILYDDYTRKPKEKELKIPAFVSSPNELFYDLPEEEAADLKRALGVNLKERNIKRTGGHNRKAVIAISPSGVELEYESLKELHAELGISETCVAGCIRSGESPKAKSKFKGWRFRYKSR